MPANFLSSIGALPAWNVPMVVLLIKATVILLAALGVTLAMQRTSAGARHLVWLVALGTLLLVPAVAVWAPLRLNILPPLRVTSDAAPAVPAPDARQDADASALATSERLARTHVPDAAAPSGTASAPANAATDRRSALSRMSVVSIAAAIWLAVVLLIAASLAWSAFVVRRIVRQARPLESDDWRTPLYEVADRLGLDEAPRLLRSDDAKMPFACGVLHPTIVLPAECDTWTLDRRTAVLLHELAHVRRHDLVGHTLGRLACALYWFHPLVWTAAKNLRSESERACDDLALACGTRATDYAEHLLEIVTSVRRDATPSVALAMARRKEFEGRMLAILDPELRHSSPSRLQSAALIGSLAVMSLVVGAASPARRAIQEPAASVARQQPSASDSTSKLADSIARHRAALVAARGGRQPEYPNDFSGAPRFEQHTNVVTHTSQETHTNVVESGLGGVSGGAATTVSTATATGSSDAAEALRRLISSGVDRNGRHVGDDRPVLLAKVLRTDTSATLRRIAAWGLNQYADTQVAEQALSEAVRTDKDEDVREMAAWSLADAKDHSAVATDALVAALHDKSDKVRSTAAWALGNMGSRGSVEALVGALGDTSPEVRKHALWAIGDIGPKQAPKAVMAMLKDKDKDVRELAAWALYEIEDPDAAPALEAALKTETDKDMQISYIRALAAAGEKSVDALRGLLESPDQRIKTMAVKALAGGQADGPWPWPMPDPRPYP